MYVFKIDVYFLFPKNELKIKISAK